MKNRPFWPLLIGGVILVLVCLSIISGKLVEWLWMTQLGYSNIFWELLFIQLAWFGLAFVVVFFYFWGNLRLVLKNSLGSEGGQDVLVMENGGEISSSRAKILSLVFAFIPALIFGLIYYSEWDTYLRFRCSRIWL